MSGAAVKWHWGLINLPPVRGVVDHGPVDSRDAAMADLRKGAALADLPPHDFGHWRPPADRSGSVAVRHTRRTVEGTVL